MPSDLHAALLDECRRLAEIAPAELAGAVAALRAVVDAHRPCTQCSTIHCDIDREDLPCIELLAIAAELGIGADHA